MTLVDRFSLVIPGEPVPLQRAGRRNGHAYLPPRSRAWRELAQACWLEAGRPSIGERPFALSARFYRGSKRRADLSNFVKALEDAGNGPGLMWDDDSQCVCFSGCHLLRADARGPRVEMDVWVSSRAIVEARDAA